VTGRRDPARPRRRHQTLLAGAAGALGLSILMVPLSNLTVADASDTAAAPSGGPATSGSSPDVRTAAAPVSGVRVVRAAADEAGHPYRYGADGPAAFDCSGLTQHVYERFGVNLPHNSQAQYRAVEHVAKSDMRPGDLLFYYDDDGIYHVGIYAGDKEIWAAGRPGEVVRKHDVWTDRFLVGRPRARS